MLPSGTGGRAPVNLGSLEGAPQQLRALPGPVLHDLLEAPLRTTAHVGQGQDAG
jgi:hypothetical protein